MTKQFKKVNRGEVTWYVVTLKDIASDAGAEADFRRHAFLQELADAVASGLLDCGPMKFETLKISHDGEGWVAVAEAEETHV